MVRDFSVELTWRDKQKPPKSSSDNDFDLLTLLKFHPEFLDIPVKSLQESLPSKKSWKNRLYLGDNRIIMERLLHEGFSESIDLIYIDPPFFTGNGGFHRVFKERMTGQVIAESRAYRDDWEGLDAYLQYLYERFFLMKELLSPHGSLFVHCDWHAGHYLKVILDEIFGYRNFRNEIAWCYTGAGQTPRYFPRKHDTIFWYVKNTNFYTFNVEAVRVPYKKSNLAAGRTSFAGRKSDQYLRKLDSRGKIIEDWWADIATIGYSHSEITGFTTQKPEALLERIIRACTNEGDLVADFFCGSGTTPVVAEKLDRRWIACDLSSIAIHATFKRLLSLEESRNLEVKARLMKYGKPCSEFLLQKLYLVKKADFRDELLDRLKYLISKWLGCISLSKSLHFDGMTTEKQDLIKISLEMPTIDDLIEIQSYFQEMKSDFHSLIWIAPIWDSASLPEFFQRFKDYLGMKFHPQVIPRLDELLWNLQQGTFLDKSPQRAKKIHHPITTPIVYVKSALELKEEQSFTPEQDRTRLLRFQLTIEEYEIPDVPSYNKALEKIADSRDLVDYWMVDVCQEMKSPFIPFLVFIRPRKRDQSMTFSTNLTIKTSRSERIFIRIRVVDLLGIESWWIQRVPITT